LRYCKAVHAVLHPPLKSILTVGGNAWRRSPMQVFYYRSRAMKKKIDETLTRWSFDAAYIHLFRMAPYGARLGSLYRILDLTDAISHEVNHSRRYRAGLSRLVYSVEGPRIERYEHDVVDRFEEVWFISERDRQAVLGSPSRPNAHIVPNGVDTERFFPTQQERDPNQLVFVGNMSVLHNIDAVRYFVENVLPQVVARIPGVRLTVAGADTVRSVKALRSPTVTVAGFVSDLNAELNNASVFVAPLRFAAGIQTKVLEAMAAGTPVVTTSIVNDGIGALPGRDLLVADDAVSMAKSIVTLCQDSERRMLLATAAREFVRRTYPWSAVTDRVRSIQVALS
jgi:glycosyltransferase involved in cell wall biosynthesis